MAPNPQEALSETAPALPAAPPPTHLRTLAVATLGVVYGDIGTSPLYAMRECFSGTHPVPPTEANVLGVVSLVFWALMLVVSVKYVGFIMRADNRGEGGILALMALVGTRRGRQQKKAYVLVLAGLFGAALLYGDGMITPAISVLSAIEGLDVATSAFSDYVVPITVLILAGLFAVQHFGTGRVGAVFGPVMLLWFVVIAALGLHAIWQHPSVLRAVSPHYAASFFLQGGWRAFLVLGSVFLAMTGAEALYADMGHFGRRPIRLTWYGLVLPALLLNYFGQGALLLREPDAVTQPFYRLAPTWAVYPLVALATLATVIASQALISAAFSLTRQALQLGYSPRLQIVHTSSREIGQIYVPLVNWALMIACIALVVGFRSSSNLAAAYGLAVTAAMAITTLLFYEVARTRWRWPRWKAGALAGAFLLMDLTFFGANLLKVEHGGWFPLVIGVVVFTLLTTWKRGRELLGERLRQSVVPVELFLRDIGPESPHRVPGTAVFMSGSPEGVPHALLHNIKHNRVLHERNVLLTLITEEVPHVPDAERLETQDLGKGFIRFIGRYGFMEGPNVPRLLELAARQGVTFKMSQTTFFLGRETLIATRRRGMAIWREKLFAWMSLNSRSATSYFRLPANRVVELGAQIEL